MSFSETLLERAQPMMSAIMSHPFVEAIANGQVPHNVLNYYVEQDEHYLKDYLQVTSLAITKTTNAEDITNLLATAAFVQNESQAHEVMLGITGHHIENWQREPETKRYTDHMYASAYHGTYAVPSLFCYHVLGVMRSLVNNSFHVALIESKTP